jgi:hypothetical protein
MGKVWCNGVLLQVGYMLRYSKARHHVIPNAYVGTKLNSLLLPTAACAKGA